MSAGSEGPGLYIHVPFCRSICPYCDFAVHLGNAEAREAYVRSLCAEIALQEPCAQPCETVYFGGGTPSSLDDEQLERILLALRERGLVERPLVHFEANPEDLSPERCERLRELGVVFLSLGVQSFVDEELHFLGRRHRNEGARRAVDAARHAGIPTVSVDFIFGLPGQSEESALRSLRAALDLEVGHLSGYQLTIHEGTHFFRRRATGRLVEMPEAEQAELFVLIHETLAEGGLAAYEVSNFARSEAHRSRHNRKYWRRVPYLGLGPSAHGFDGRRRSWNFRETERWAASIAEGRRPVEGEEILEARDHALEELFLGLRQPVGIDLGAFAAHHGIALDALNAELFRTWEDEGLVTRSDGLLQPTPRGLAVSDGLVCQIALD